MVANVKGLDNVLRNLNKEIRKIEGDVEDGLKAAAIFVQGESQEVTPRLTSVLVNSAFTDFVRTGKRLIARIGYTAKYALFVHEMPSSNTFTTPDTGPKFLEKVIKRNPKTILNIIKKRAKIKR